MALLVGVIICRTALSDRIAHLNGETMRHIIGQDRRQFITLLGGSIIQAAFDDALKICRRNRAHGRLGSPRKLPLLIEQAAFDRPCEIAELNGVGELEI